MGGRSAALLGIVLLCALAAGCGGGGGGDRLDKNDYAERLRGIELGPLTEDAARLFFKITSERSGCLAQARAFAADLHKILAEVEALTPPRDAEDLQRQFVEEASTSVQVVDGAVAAIAAGTLRCGQPLNKRIYGLPSTTRAQAAMQGLQKKGYLVSAGD